MRAGKPKNLTGQRFGRLTALERLDEKNRSSYMWRCRCDCGKEVKVRVDALTTGNTISCGCAAIDARKKRRKDISGHHFGKLIAVKPTEGSRHGSVLWECQCSCGKTAYYTYIELMYSNIRSCGCGQHPSTPLKMHYINGTCVEMLEKRCKRKDNTSGHTGVTQTKHGWIARIGFKGVTYYLGSYQDYNSAVRARERAEKELHGAFLDWFHENHMAVSDPFPSQKSKDASTLSSAPISGKR